jgi:transposase
MSEAHTEITVIPDPEIVTKIAELRRQGKTRDQIAGALDVSVSEVRSLVQRYKIPPKVGRSTEPKSPQWMIYGRGRPTKRSIYPQLRLENPDASEAKLAEIAGVSLSTISRWKRYFDAQGGKNV